MQPRRLLLSGRPTDRPVASDSDGDGGQLDLSRTACAGGKPDSDGAIASRICACEARATPLWAQPGRSSRKLR
jgi:hypothetical protein